MPADQFVSLKIRELPNDLSYTDAMQAMLYEGKQGELRLGDAPKPEPFPGQVRVRVHACGVCRTDLHIIDGDLRNPKLPLIPDQQLHQLSQSGGLRKTLITSILNRTLRGNN